MKPELTNQQGEVLPLLPDLTLADEDYTSEDLSTFPVVVAEGGKDGQQEELNESFNKKIREL